LNKAYLLGKLSPFAGKKNLLVHDQQVKDIVSAMLNAHQKYAGEYDKISMDFYTGNGVGTAKKIFDFLKKNVRYKIESENNQRILSPSAILSLASNGADCKTYALYIMGILDSLKRKGLIDNKIFYRFASYKLLDEVPHHVFAVIVDKNGNEVFIDPVLQNFNERRTYFHKIDKVPNMAMYSVSGVYQGKNVNGIFDFLKKKQPAQTTTSSAPAEAPKKKKIVLKFALAPMRGSFLLLVGLNAFGLATKIKKAFDTKANDTKNFWEGLGGNANELLRKTNQGAVKKRLLGTDIFASTEGQIGVVATGTAIAVTTSAPILVKIAQFLAKIGIDTKELGEVAKDVLSKTIKSKLNRENASEQDIEIETENEVNRIVNEVEDTSAGSRNIIPYVIGAGAVLYLISRKK